jgi:hypothetical protein
MRGAAAGCVLAATFVWLSGTTASALGPDKTAWYDNSGLQSATGETTPSVASNGQLEVQFAPAGATAPSETLPNAPTAPPTLPPSAPVGVPTPTGGKVGGSAVGYTLAFAEVEYTVPLQVGGQTIDPASLHAVLTLSLDPQTSSNMGSGDVVACPTTNNLWAAGDDQQARQASPYDCSAGHEVTGNYDATSNTITFELASAQAYQEPSGLTGIYSLALVPGTSPSGAFTAVINPPSPSSYALTAESPVSNPNQNVAAPAPGTAGAPATAPLTVAPPTSAFQHESSGLQGTPGSVSISPVTPAPAPAPIATPIAAPNAAALGTSTTTSTTTGLLSGYPRAVAVILLMALGAGLWVGAQRKRRSPKSLRPLHAAPA